MDKVPQCALKRGGGAVEERRQRGILINILSAADHLCQCD